MAGLVLMLLTGGAVAGGNDWSEKQWPELTAQIHDWFAMNRSRLDSIREVISVQRPADLRAGKEGLIVKWTKDSVWMAAPDDLQARVMEDFHSLLLLSVKTDEDGVKYLFRTAGLGFGKAAVYPAVLFSQKQSDELKKCTDEMLINTDAGRCLLPLEKPHWYMVMDWAHL